MSAGQNSRVTRYARNAREIARALGLKVKPKQCAEVIEWTHREDFPAKTRKGWVVGELRVFFDKITPELARRKFQAEVADPESKLSPAAYNKLVDLAGGDVSSSMLPDGRNGRNGPDEIPGVISGMDALGALIMRQFPKIGLQVNRQTIQNWRRLKAVPSGCNVPFPPPSNGNRYNTAECFAWVQTYFGPQLNMGGQPELLFGATQELENKIKDRKLRLMDLEVGAAEGKLTDTKIAQNTISAALKRYHGIVRTQLERLEIKSVTDFHASIGLTDEQKAALHGFHLELARATLDKIEAACELIARGQALDGRNVSE